jgi:acetone carboxylase gamma subunit
MSYPQKKIEELVDGTIDPDTLHTMLSAPKDQDRFTKYLEVLQARVPWDDPILLPYGPHLYCVQKKDTKQWVIRCGCGHDFCDQAENWKLNALVNVRDTPEEMAELYPNLMAPTSSWQVIREYFCPECATLHDVEAPTPWYPVIKDFEPDIETFYRDWLNLQVPERA